MSSHTAAITCATRTDLASVQLLDILVIGSRKRAKLLAQAVAAAECWLIRLNSGVLVGFVLMSRSFFGHWFIELLIVHPQHRRCGHATTLLQHCESICMGEKLFTSTNQSNTPMQHLLARLGYERSGYIENLDDGDPELIYVKHLRAHSDTTPE